MPRSSPSSCTRGKEQVNPSFDQRIQLASRTAARRQESSQKGQSHNAVPRLPLLACATHDAILERERRRKQVCYLRI